MVFAPVFPPFFLGVMGLMKGDSFSVIKQKIQKVCKIQALLVNP